jgi:hypothetical protein
MALRDMGPLARRTATLVAAALSAGGLGGCVLPRRAGPDPSFARPNPGTWKTVAVLPFGGEASLRRPAEEWVAIRLREQAAVGVMPPFAVGGALAAASVLPSPAEGWFGEVQGWTAAWANAAPAAASPVVPGRDRVRELADALGADALVLGSVNTDRASDGKLAPAPTVDLLLVDAGTGDAAAFVRRWGDVALGGPGMHACAMGAADRAAEALLLVLRAKAGETAPVHVPQPPTPEPFDGSVTP